MVQFRAGAVSELSGICELAVSGEVDMASAEELYAAAAACLDTNAQTLSIDLAMVTFLDSTGIGALVRVRNMAEQRSKALVLANPSPSVAKVLAITGLDAVFAIENRLDTTLDGHH